MSATLAAVLEAVSEIDRGHPALAELTFDDVAVLEGGVQAGEGIVDGLSTAPSHTGSWTPRLCCLPPGNAPRRGRGRAAASG